MKQIELKYIVKGKDLLLNFLLNNIEGKSKNNIKSLLSYGNVYVNDKKITQYDYELKKEDKIIVKLVSIGKFKDKNRLDILYEDNYLLIVNKSAHLLTIGTAKEKEKTLYYYVSNYVKKESKNNKIFIVNRLDKDTSGIVVFAKDEKTKRLLQNNWDSNVKLRKYITIVEGITDNEGTIKSYLCENSEYYVYSTNDKKNKLAITKYKKIKSNNKYSLLEVILETGRKNQIRVHMKDINHPVVGDVKYGSTINPIKRLALHSSNLDLIHPITKKILKLKCDMPNIFNKLV